MQQGGLPCTVRSDQPDDLPFGDGQRVQSERAPAPSVPLAEAGSLQYGGHATPRRKQLRNAVRRWPRCRRTEPCERAETNHLAMEARNLA